MAKSRKPVGTESDIIDEIDGERLDPEDPTSPIMIDMDQARELGALDADSVRQNRRNQAVIERKIEGEKSVAFDEHNPLLKYEQVIVAWGLESISIVVTRLNGSQPVGNITSRPKTAQELYAALMVLHGRREETTYDLIFHDSTARARRGATRIVLPSTLDEQQPAQVQPMNPYHPYPQGYPPPPGYAQSAPMPAQAPPQPQPPQPQPAPQPVILQTPQVAPGLDVGAIMAMQKQTMDMILAMQRGQVAPPVQMPQPVQTPISQQQQPQGGFDLGAIMAMQKQTMDMILAMQQGHQPPPQPPPPVQVTAPAPAPQSQPDVMTMMMAMQKQTLDMVLAMQRAAQPPPQPREEPYRAPYRGPAYGPRPPYRADDEPPPYAPRSAYGASPYAQQPPQASPPPVQKPVMDQVQDAVQLLNSITKISSQFSGNQQPQQQEVYAPDDEDDNPVRVTETGNAKLVFDKKTGAIRSMETLWANLPELTKFAGKQFEQLQRNTVALQQKKQQQQLPPGYVEVTEDYKPPPGYTAVPIDRVPPSPPNDLPPQPDDLPPPIDAQEEEKPRWKNPYEEQP